jgi:hypothetical protein
MTEGVGNVGDGTRRWRRRMILGLATACAAFALGPVAVASATITLDSGPGTGSPSGTTTTNHKPSWIFHSDMTPILAGNYTCQVDSGSVDSCGTWSTANQQGSYMAASTLTDGSHTLTIKAVNGASVEQDSGTFSFTVTTPPPPDTTPPDTTILSGPPGFATNGTATFTFASTEAGSGFQCQLDGGAFTGCMSPQTYTGLGDGTHNFAVKATDNSGNTDPTPATRSWFIQTQVLNPDTTGPKVILNTKTATMTRNGIVAVRITCPRSEPDVCSGVLQLRTASGRKVILGQKGYPLGSGQSRTLKVRLPVKNRKIVVKAKKLRVKVVIRAKDLASNVRTNTAYMTLKAPR